MGEMIWHAPFHSFLKWTSERVGLLITFILKSSFEIIRFIIFILISPFSQPACQKNYRPPKKPMKPATVKGFKIFALQQAELLNSCFFPNILGLS
jgi:hypothetical protein